MAININQPMRMCVVCRERFMQRSLIRLQCQEGILQRFGGQGRSFYICSHCIEDKRTLGQLGRHCKSKEVNMLMNRLKEIVVNDG